MSPSLTDSAKRLVSPPDKIIEFETVGGDGGWGSGSTADVVVAAAVEVAAGDGSAFASRKAAICRSRSFICESRGWICGVAWDFAPSAPADRPSTLIRARVFGPT